MTEMQKIKNFVYDQYGYTGKIEKIGNGAYANVYKFGDKIVKFTTDISDAIQSYRMIGKKIRNIVKTFDVFNVTEHFEYDQSYFIINEYIDILDDSDISLLIRFNGGYNKHKFHTYSDMKFMLKLYRSGLKIKIMPEKRIRWVVKEIITIIRELKKYNIDSFDFHNQNVVLTKDEEGLKLIYIDLGWESVNMEQIILKNKIKKYENTI